MIVVSIKKNKSEIPEVISVSGHAEYEKYGKDIICAAVSMLVINTANSLEAFLPKKDYEYSSQNNVITIHLKNVDSTEGVVLMKSLLLGLETTKNEYGKKFITLNYEEV